MSSVVKTTLVITVLFLLILITNTAQAVTIGTFEWHMYSEDEAFLYGPYFFSVTNDSSNSPLSCSQRPSWSEGLVGVYHQL